LSSQQFYVMNVTTTLASNSIANSIIWDVSSTFFLHWFLAQLPLLCPPSLSYAFSSSSLPRAICAAERLPHCPQAGPRLCSNTGARFSETTISPKVHAVWPHFPCVKNMTENTTHRIGLIIIWLSAALRTCANSQQEEFSWVLWRAGLNVPYCKNEIDICKKLLQKIARYYTITVYDPVLFCSKLNYKLF